MFWGRVYSSKNILQGTEAGFNVLLAVAPMEIHPIKANGIDAELVKRATVTTSGGVTPSGMDAHVWRRILTTNQNNVQPFRRFLRNYTQQTIQQNL